MKTKISWGFTNSCLNRNKVAHVRIVSHTSRHSDRIPSRLIRSTLCLLRITLSRVRGVTPLTTHSSDPSFFSHLRCEKPQWLLETHSGQHSLPITWSHPHTCPQLTTHSSLRPGSDISQSVQLSPQLLRAMTLSRPSSNFPIREDFSRHAPGVIPVVSTFDSSCKVMLSCGDTSSESTLTPRVPLDLETIRWVFD